MIEIITAEPNHFPIMSAIYAASWRSAYQSLVPQAYLDSIADDRWVPHFAQGYAEGQRGYKLILADGRAVGAASFGPGRDEHAPPAWGDVYSIYMLPEEAGKGYGKQLMAAVLDDLRAEGYKGAYLFCLDGNINAHHFYVRCGFTRAPDGDKPCEIAGEILTTLRFDMTF